MIYAWRITEPAGGDVARAVSERNPYYWKVDTEGNQLPYIDRIEWEFLGDPEVLLLRTLNGEVEFMNYYANALQNKAVFFDNMEEGDYHFFDQIRDTANTLMLHLNMNTKNEALREVFQNKDFRIALSHAINRQEIIDTVFVGQGIPYQGAPKPTSEYYNEDAGHPVHRIRCGSGQRDSGWHLSLRRTATASAWARMASPFAST